MAKQELSLDEALDEVMADCEGDLITADELREVNAEAARFAQKLMESNEALLPEVQIRKIIG